MIEFTSVRVKNFFSVGKKWMGYDFVNGQVYLATGKNGSGKSCILLDGLMFALYSKAFRNINIGQIANSINGKDCVVEVEFKIGAIDYKVVRGLHPGFMEIWVNGVLKNKDANKIDYQRYLENQILRMDEKTFKQIVVLGSKDYIPFMKLSKGDRRVVVEDLLNLSIFTSMANVIKTKLGALQTEARNLDTDMKYLVKQVTETKSTIDMLRSSGDTYVKNKQDQVEKHQKIIDTLRKAITKAEKDIDKLLDGEDQEKVLGKIQSDKIKLIEMTSAIESSIKKIMKETVFFQNNETCPTCHQDISDDLKEETIAENEKKAAELKVYVDKSQTERETLDMAAKTTQELLLRIRKIRDVIKGDLSEIKSNETIIRVLNTDIKDHASRSGTNVSIYETKLVELNEDMANKKARDFEILSEGKRLMYIHEMVKDGGIKNKIILQYLPLINKLIRKYLDVMESDIDFVFDENFKETIKSRYRDNFSYSSFSEGQKLRIDLCLLFAWREISRMRNSAATNLIVFDEIGDSSLDAEGFECFMNIVASERAHQCIVVISHSPEKLANKVNRVYEFDLVRNFTTLKSLTHNTTTTSLT